MHLSDVCIVPGITAGCVVEGRFNLETPHHSGDLFQPAGAQLSFRIRGPYGGLCLHDLTRDPDGLFSPASQTSQLSLNLPLAVDLEQLLHDMSWAPAGQGVRRVE